MNTITQLIIFATYIFLSLQQTFSSLLETLQKFLSTFWTSVFNLFAAAEPLAHVDVSHGTPGPALASAGPNAKPRRGAPVSGGAMTLLCVSQPLYNLFMKMFKANHHA